MYTHTYTQAQKHTQMWEHERTQFKFAHTHLHNHTYYKSNIAVTNGLHSTIREPALTSLKLTIPADTCTDKSLALRRRTQNCKLIHTIKEEHTRAHISASARVRTTACVCAHTVCDISFPFNTAQLFSAGDLKCKCSAASRRMCCTIMWDIQEHSHLTSTYNDWRLIKCPLNIFCVHAFSNTSYYSENLLNIEQEIQTFIMRTKFSVQRWEIPEKVQNVMI